MGRHNLSIQTATHLLCTHSPDQMTDNLTDNLTTEQISELRETFVLFDKDGDGAITTAELGTVMKSLGQTPTDMEVKEMVDEVDVDKNGTIEFPEFLMLMGRRMIETDEMEDVIKAFRVFDKNETGFIHSSELRYVLKTLGEELTDREIDEIIKEIDLDADGQL